jgi:regulator of PEP synthase PpsR (kinase-PPPase family)
VCARFTDVLPIEHIYALVRSPRQLERALDEIANAPGAVMHTIVDAQLRSALEQGCQLLDMPCIAALDPLVSALTRYIGAPLSTQVGAQYALDTDYFNRMDALSYAIGHDDGHGGQDLSRADVVLVGVSRTSKTPTCMYLANRGVKAANVPWIPGMTVAPELLDLKGPLIVGLTKEAKSLADIRRSRLKFLQQDEETDYADEERVKAEVAEARRFFARQGWPVIDVTRRSIEEASATILQLLTQKREEAGEKVR